MTHMESEVFRFCQLVRARSEENRRAFRCLHEIESLSQQMAVLRQELDSMVRVTYLLASDEVYRIELIRSTLSGQKWRIPNSRAAVTDKDMVALANKLTGWAEYVYSFGCAFIHLTNATSIELTDRLSAFPNVTESDRTAIMKYMHNYHGGPLGDDPTLKEFACYLPQVFEKIAVNLECYLRMLKENRRLDERKISHG